MPLLSCQALMISSLSIQRLHTLKLGCPSTCKYWTHPGSLPLPQWPITPLASCQQGFFTWNFCSSKQTSDTRKIKSMQVGPMDSTPAYTTSPKYMRNQEKFSTLAPSCSKEMMARTECDKLKESTCMHRETSKSQRRSLNLCRVTPG